MGFESMEETFEKNVVKELAECTSRHEIKLTWSRLIDEIVAYKCNPKFHADSAVQQTIKNRRLEFLRGAVMMADHLCSVRE